jgi:glycerol-3-phosphate dehydrogenase
VSKIPARVLVPAGGPWVERGRWLCSPQWPGFELDLVGGTHVELEGTIARGIYYCAAPRHRRAVFTMPWHGRTLVGTTERAWTGDPADVSPSAEEIDYLEGIFRPYFPGRPLQRVDAWAGLRVLPRAAGRAFDRPRETTLVVDDDARPHAVAIYGGKLTGYRATALKALDRVAKTLPHRERVADTATLRLEPDR